jgi:hypothetical protein
VGIVHAHPFFNQLKLYTMCDAYTLKQIFRRSNETENQILSNIIDTYYPDIRIIRGRDIPNVQWCVKNGKGLNVLILDAKNPNVTEIGNNNITEFCFIDKSGNITWIDAKHLNKTTNIADSVLGDMMTRAINCPGKFLYVCDGKGYTDKIVEKFKKQIVRYNFFNVDVIKLCNFTLAVA